MGELARYFKITKNAVKIKNGISTKPKFSPIFEFPFTDDYCKWINNRSKTFPKGRKPNGFWNNFYGEIIDNQINPIGVKVPKEWYQKLTSYPTKCVYMIADDKEKLLYIGKCEYTPVIRLLDRLIPKKLNPQENNVPRIWDEYISQGIKVKCAYCYNLSFDPGILEYLLLDVYKSKKGISGILNKKMPSWKYRRQALQIKSKLGI